jgi:hypothetical protein
MTTTREYIALLSVGGHARNFMLAAPNGGDWVNGFCDGLIERLSLQDRLEGIPKSKINLWLNDTHIWQVNVDIGRQGAWSIATGDDLLLNLVKTLENR